MQFVFAEIANLESELLGKWQYHLGSPFTDEHSATYPGRWKTWSTTDRIRIRCGCPLTGCVRDHVGRRAQKRMRRAELDRGVYT
jgi:hypothetical protein